MMDNTDAEERQKRRLEFRTMFEKNARQVKEFSCSINLPVCDIPDFGINLMIILTDY